MKSIVLKSNKKLKEVKNDEEISFPTAVESGDGDDGVLEMLNMVVGVRRREGKVEHVLKEVVLCPLKCVIGVLDNHQTWHIKRKRVQEADQGIKLANPSK